jgi:hypothetical protein
MGRGHFTEQRKPGDRTILKLECLRMLATLRLDPARTFLISGFVDTYLRLNVSEQAKFQEEIARIETVQEQEEVMQITTSWMEEGLEQGLEKGRKGMEQMLRKSLAHKFGQLPTELVDRLQGLSIEHYHS